MEVHRELSEIIRTEIKDPRVSSAMTTVVAVEVTPDLKYCKAYISVLGGDEAAKNAVTGLKNAVGYIRRELAAGSTCEIPRRFRLFWISRLNMV